MSTVVRSGYCRSVLLLLLEFTLMSSPSHWTLSFQAVADPGEGQRWSTWRSVEKVPAARAATRLGRDRGRRDRHRARHSQDRQGSRRLPRRARRART